MSATSPNQTAVSSGILHVVGHVTDEVAGFFGPAVRALAASRRLQVIVLIDAAEYRHNTEQFGSYAKVIRVAEMSNPFKQWTEVLAALGKEFARLETGAVHAHGVVPFLMICWKLRTSSGTRCPVFYSPYGSGSFRLIDLPVKLTMLAARPHRSAAIVQAPHDVDAFEFRGPRDLVECPIGDVFFSTPRDESKTPLIIGSGRHGHLKGAELFTQLAVQLSGEELGLDFRWLGAAPVAAESKLHAAGVAVLPFTRDEECAAYMRSAWMHVTPWPTGGFPFFLAQAMASGVPCIAIDCRQHREMIENGRTGFLCSSETEMVARIAELIDDAALRRRIGSAGRHSAKERFDESNFQARLLTAYSTLW